MEDINSTSLKCVYCKLSIYTDDFGWGYDQDGYDRNYWHMECLNLWEDVAV